MRFSSYALAGFVLFGAALAAETADFVPFTKPAKDETIPTGANYTLKWDAGSKYDGQMKLSVWKGDDIDELEAVTGFDVTVDIKAGSYKVKVPGALDDQDATHRVKAIYGKDETIYNFSPPFHFSKKSDGSNDSDETSTTTGASSTTTGGASTVTGSTLTTTGASATTGDTSTSISTSDPPGQATGGPEAPLALLGAIAFGAIML